MSNIQKQVSAKTIAITRVALLPTITAFWLASALAVAINA